MIVIIIPPRMTDPIVLDGDKLREVRDYGSGYMGLLLEGEWDPNGENNPFAKFVNEEMDDAD